jgi:phage shock protein A
MGIFSRFKRAAKSTLNNAVDKAIDPKKELEMAITTLEDQKKSALKELLSFKTTAKRLEQEMAAKRERIKSFEDKAMRAVKAGDDALAKACLKEKKQSELELQSMQTDFDEAARYALELNRSRKTLETKLQTLKLRKGTLATQITTARTGKGIHDPAVFEKFDKASEGIEDDAIQGEVMAEMSVEERANDLLQSALDEAGGPADDALAELKAKMARDRK